MTAAPTEEREGRAGLCPGRRSCGLGKRARHMAVSAPLREKGLTAGPWAVRPGRAAEDAERRANLLSPRSRRDSAGPSHRSEPEARPPEPGAARRGRVPGFAAAASTSALPARARAVLTKEILSRAPRRPRASRGPGTKGRGRSRAARELLQASRLPGSPAACPELPFIYLFWWRKAGSSILEQQIFPGSLYLLIFQFLAAALSAWGWGWGGGRAKFKAARVGAAEHGRLFSAGLRRWGRGAVPAPPRHVPLRRRQELPGPPWGAGTTVAGDLGSVALGGSGGRGGPRVCDLSGDGSFGFPERGRWRERGGPLSQQMSARSGRGRGGRKGGAGSTPAWRARPRKRGAGRPPGPCGSVAACIRGEPATVRPRTLKRSGRPF